MLLQTFNPRDVCISGFCSSPLEYSSITKFWKPFLFENLFSHFTYLKITIIIGNMSFEMAYSFSLITVWDEEIRIQESENALWEFFRARLVMTNFYKLFSDSQIKNFFISHINSYYWNSMGHFKTLPTFVMDGVPYGNFNPQAYENYFIKLYRQEKARNLSLSIKLWFSGPWGWLFLGSYPHRRGLDRWG